MHRVWPDWTVSPSWTNGAAPGSARPVEHPDHRRLDAHDPVLLGRRKRRLVELRRLCGSRRGRHRRLLAAADRHAHPVLLDRDLGNARLLHDAHELADALRLRAVDAAGRERLLAARAPADRSQQRLGVLAEEREQEQLLLARGETLGLVAELGQVRRRLFLGQVAGDEVDRAADAFVDRDRRRSVPAADQRAELVHNDLVTGGGEHVYERLGSEDLPDRRGQRRPAGLGPDPGQLGEDFVDTVAGGLRAELSVE